MSEERRSITEVDPTDLDPLLLDGPALAKQFGLHPGTLRNWASAGLLVRRGRDAGGRVLYDYDEVAALATRRGPAPAVESMTVTVSRRSIRLPAAKRCEVQLKDQTAAGRIGSHRSECGAAVNTESPVPLCEAHLRQVFLFMADRLTAWRDRDRVPNESPRGPLSGADPNRVVYYARRRQLFKIGTTDNVPRRMLQLDVDELLATEPGGAELEAMRLRQFDHLRIAPGTEWLYGAAELDSHIAMVRKYNPMPELPADDEVLG